MSTTKKDAVKTTAKNTVKTGNTSAAGKKTFRPIISEEKSSKEVSVIPSTVRVATVSKETQINELLSRVEKLENLKKYYGKLKVKKNSLEKAFKKMAVATETKSDQFEEQAQIKFPFKISLIEIDEYDRKNEIFEISKKQTVTRFTEFLLSQITELLEAFEMDLIEEAKKGNL